MKTKTILPITALVVGALSFAFLSSKDEAPKKAPPVAKKEAPPVKEDAPAPAAEEPEPEPDPALREALLGLNKKSEVAEAPVQQPAPKRIVRRVRRRPDPEPQAEEVDLSLTDYDFQSTVGSWGGVKRCLATSSVRGDQPMSGALQVSFKISSDGEVIESKVTDVSNEDARTLASCVERKARRIRFPAFAGNDITKTAKFVF